MFSFFGSCCGNDQIEGDEMQANRNHLKLRQATITKESKMPDPIIPTWASPIAMAESSDFLRDSALGCRNGKVVVYSEMHMLDTKSNSEQYVDTGMTKTRTHIEMRGI